MPTTLVGLRNLIALLLLRCLYPIAMRQAQAAVVLPLPAISQSETTESCRWTLLSLARPIEIAPTHRARQILSHGQWQEPAIFLLPKRTPSNVKKMETAMSDIESRINAVVAASEKRNGVFLLTRESARAMILTQREFDTGFCASSCAPAARRPHPDVRGQ